MTKKTNDEITELFRSRLVHAKLPPRDGFWEEIQNDISFAQKKKRHFLIYRTAAAASILLILGAASAAFLYFIPKEEIKQNLTKMNTVSDKFTRIQNNHHTKDIYRKSIATTIINTNPKISKATIKHLSPANKSSKQTTSEINEDSTVTVTVHMTIRVKKNNEYADNSINDNNNGIWQAGNFNHTSTPDQTKDTPDLASSSKNNNTWALKAALNIATPSDGKFEAPVGGSFTVEKMLNKWLSAESGLQYNYFHSNQQTLHYLSVPLKVNIILAKLSKLDLYTTIGGSADKCISASTSPANENIQFSASVGAGVRYQVNRKISLYAEPTIIHYYNHDPKYISYRTEKSNTLNLQCGLCMTY